MIDNYFLHLVCEQPLESLPISPILDRWLYQRLVDKLVVKCCCMCQTGSFLLSLLVANEEWHATTPGTTTVYSVQLQKINGEPHSDYFLVNFM